MKKPPKAEPESIKGWTFIDNVRGNCYACGKYLEPSDLVYWRKDEGRSRVACQPCAREVEGK